MNAKESYANTPLPHDSRLGMQPVDAGTTAAIQSGVGPLVPRGRDGRLRRRVSENKTITVATWTIL